MRPVPLLWLLPREAAEAAGRGSRSQQKQRLNPLRLWLSAERRPLLECSTPCQNLAWGPTRLTVLPSTS